jgi:hypothetical protein
MAGYDAKATRLLAEREAAETAGEIDDERSLDLYGELPEAVWTNDTPAPEEDR